MSQSNQQIQRKLNKLITLGLIVIAIIAVYAIIQRKERQDIELELVKANQELAILDNSIRNHKVDLDFEKQIRFREEDRVDSLNKLVIAYNEKVEEKNRELVSITRKYESISNDSLQRIAFERYTSDYAGIQDSTNIETIQGNISRGFIKWSIENDDRVDIYKDLILLKDSTINAKDLIIVSKDTIIASYEKDAITYKEIENDYIDKITIKDKVIAFKDKIIKRLRTYIVVGGVVTGVVIVTIILIAI